MKSFVYAWQDTGVFPNKWYIGRKIGDYNTIAAANNYRTDSGIVDDEMDKRPADFRRILLMGFEDKVSHAKLEAEMLRAVDAAHNPLYYNQHNEDGRFFCRMVGESNPAKRSEVRRKIRRANKGKPHSEEHRRKLSAAFKGKKRVLTEDGSSLH